MTWILEQTADGTWSCGVYKLYKGDIFNDLTKGWYLSCRLSARPACKTRSEAILKFQLERPDEKLYEIKPGTDRGLFESEEDFLGILNEV